MKQLRYSLTALIALFAGTAAGEPPKLPPAPGESRAESNEASATDPLEWVQPVNAPVYREVLKDDKYLSQFAQVAAKIDIMALDKTDRPNAGARVVELTTGGQGERIGIAEYVLQRLPDDYMVSEADLQWLDICDGFLQGPPTNESVTAATREALVANPRGHIDPFELLIDADVCDTKCDPRP